MDWTTTKSKLQEAAQKIKQNKFIDATVEALLSQIPVIGPFASKYWSIIEGDDAEKAAKLARLLETAAQQQEQFNSLRQLIQEDRDLLLQNAAYLDTVLDQLTSIGADIKAVKAQQELLNTRVEFMLRHLNVRTVADAFTVSVSLEEDRSRAAELISQIREVLEKAGEEAEPDNYYLLGVLYVSLNEFEKAEASFLSAIEVAPDMGKAYLGLGMMYQLQANEMVRKDNFGLAEDILNKAESYVKIALQYDAADPHVHVHLGYVYKEFAQRYAGAGKHAKANVFLQKATSHFKMALGADEDNADARNGLGSVYLIQGDYDSAIKESRRATELNPKYLFAFYDLASAYYGKARTATSELDQAKALQGFLEAYQAVLSLDGQDSSAGSLPPVARQNLSAIASWVLQKVESIS